MADIFTALSIASSGMQAQRIRVNTVASNLANASTTRTEEGGPYRRLDPVFRAVPVEESFEATLEGMIDEQSNKVEVVEVSRDPSPPRKVYDPQHPDADAEGYVLLPNINVPEEMVNMITASRSYAACANVFETIKQMARGAVDLLK